jgi:hypothetical protein
MPELCSFLVPALAAIGRTSSCITRPLRVCFPVSRLRREVFVCFPVSRLPQRSVRSQERSSTLHGPEEWAGLLTMILSVLRSCRDGDNAQVLLGDRSVVHQGLLFHISGAK